jgi:integrase
MQKSVKIASSMREKNSAGAAKPSAKPNRKFKHLSVDEVRRLLQVIPREKIRDRLLFDLIYHYGLRRTEACLLQIEDINLRRNTIQVHRLKGSDSHPYPLFPSTKKLLTEYLAQYRDPEHHTWTRNLFPSRQRYGKPISASLVAFLFRDYAKAARIPSDRQNVHAYGRGGDRRARHAGLDGARLVGIDADLHACQRASKDENDEEDARIRRDRMIGLHAFLQ